MRTVEERFLAKVELEPNTGCWLWTGLLDRKGYGRFLVGSKTDGSHRMVSSHRVAYELYVGPIPAGMSCLHRCDTPGCVAPPHLFLGTTRDNQTDMAKKWRGRKSKHGLPFGTSRVGSRYVARAFFEGRQLYLGRYLTAEEANAVAVAEKIRLRGMN
jgi:hypothetical protein